MSETEAPVSEKEALEVVTHHWYALLYHFIPNHLACLQYIENEIEFVEF